MAKKRRSSGKPGKPGSKNNATGFPPGLAVFIGFLLGAGLTWLVLQEPMPNKNPGLAPTPTPTGPAQVEAETGGDGTVRLHMQGGTFQQQQSIKMMEQQFNAQIQLMNQNPGLIPAEDDDLRYRFFHAPSNRHLLLLGRAHPEDRDRWTALVARTGPSPFTGEAPEQGLVVEASFELGGAHAMETAAFSESGHVMMVLTRAHNRGQGPGDLIRLVPGESHAKRIDTDVFRFLLSPDGDAVIYERATDPEDHLGPRELKLFHASRRETHQILEYAFPRTQLGVLGPWDSSGVFADLSVLHFEDGFEPSSEEHYKIDGFNPTKLIPVPQEEEASASQGEETSPEPEAPAGEEGEESTPE